MAKKQRKRNIHTNQSDIIDETIWSKLSDNFNFAKAKIGGIITFIIAITGAVFKFGQSYEHVVQLKKQTEIENRLNKEILETKEKFLLQIIELKSENGILKIRIEQYEKQKTKY